MQPMTTSNTAIPAGSRDARSVPGVYNTSEFWEHLWRTSGIHFVAFAIIAYAIYGSLPVVGAPTDTLLAFYSDHRVRIPIAAVFSGLAVLNLMWFSAALRSTLADSDKDGWGGAATAASAALGGLMLVLVMVSAMPAYSTAGSGSAFASGFHDFVWAGIVLSSFPRAMLIMAGTFGLWRAGIISNKLFAAGVIAVVLVLLGGTTWMNSGLWAPDGAYSRIISPAIGFAWVVVVSRVLLNTSSVSRARW